MEVLVLRHIDEFKDLANAFIEWKDGSKSICLCGPRQRIALYPAEETYVVSFHQMGERRLLHFLFLPT